MVNSKITTNNNEQIEFPHLMANDDVVVWFQNKREGIVIHRFSNISVPLGARMINGNFNIDNFKVFNSSIELCNSK